MPDMKFSSYFYGDEAMQFTYFRIPCQFITHPRFKHLSTDSKLLYGMLLDRMSLSIKNEWYDDTGRVYIYYTVDEVYPASKHRFCGCSSSDREDMPLLMS